MSRKRKANEMEEQQYPEVWEKGRGQHGGDVATNAIVEQKATYPYTFTDSMAKDFPYITKSKKGNGYAHCTVCKCEICVKWRGKSALSRHQNTAKHKQLSTEHGKG
jgi:hypothetical protein